MKVKKLFICYIGILCGTVLANFYLNDLSFLFQDFNMPSETRLLTLMIKRSIEIVFLVYIGMVINRKVWEGIIDYLSGVALGIMISVKTMIDGLFPTILFSLLALIVVVLYNIALKLTMAESIGQHEVIHAKLHNSFLNKIMILAIIFVNAFLESVAMKIF